ncbi:MAG: hypothetical protein IT375_20395 [Polyangiaceae bacterium]|nr:hypothetical protein [Polyangiaceae bacterium]
MRVRSASVGIALAVAVAAAVAGAQTKAPESSPPAKASEKTEPKAAAKAGDAKGGDAKGGDAKGGDAKAPEKPAGPTPGYTWSDKPAKGGKWKPKKKLDPNAPIATFPGFRMLGDGSSQLWVHVSKKVAVTAAATSFVLVGAQVAVRNNTNALVTEYFDTPLARAKLKPDAAGAQLVLEMRESAAAKHRVVDGPGGSMVLYIDLPKSQKSYSGRDDFDPDARSHRATGKVLPGKSGAAAPKRGPSQ